MINYSVFFCSFNSISVARVLSCTIFFFPKKFLTCSLVSGDMRLSGSTESSHERRDKISSRNCQLFRIITRTQLLLLFRAALGIVLVVRVRRDLSLWLSARTHQPSRWRCCTMLCCAPQLSGKELPWDDQDLHDPVLCQRRRGPHADRGQLTKRSLQVHTYCPT